MIGNKSISLMSLHQPTAPKRGGDDWMEDNGDNILFAS
jgi:hypothetical protein